MTALDGRFDGIPPAGTSIEGSSLPKSCLAERVGFEPTVLAHTCFQDRTVQPLRHLSAGEDTKQHAWSGPGGQLATFGLGLRWDLHGVPALSRDDSVPARELRAVERLICGLEQHDPLGSVLGRDRDPD